MENLPGPSRTGESPKGGKLSGLQGTSRKEKGKKEVKLIKSQGWKLSKVNTPTPPTKGTRGGNQGFKRSREPRKFKTSLTRRTTLLRRETPLSLTQKESQADSSRQQKNWGTGRQIAGDVRQRGSGATNQVRSKKRKKKTVLIPGKLA